MKQKFPLFLKVLVVDDHTLSREVISDVLRRHKVKQILTASDGVAARDMIERAHMVGEPFDIVFLDWDMPILAGIEVLKFFRALPDHSKMAFIMFTAESKQSEVLAAIKAGANAYIVKPVSRDTIGKKFMEIVDWVRKKRLE